MSTVYLMPTNPVPNSPRMLEFPYTPAIEYSNEVKYDHYSLVHTNYQPLAYAKTDNPQLSVTAKFSSHTVDHFKISERAIRFLRTYTKMNYGRIDEQRGQAPRILRFFALGEPLFHKVPVVIGRFNVNFPEDVDYIKGIFDPEAERDVNIKEVQPIGKGSNLADNGQPLKIEVNGTSNRDSKVEFYLPAVFTINITLLIQQNIAKTVNEFSLSKFASGAMNKDGYI